MDLKTPKNLVLKTVLIEPIIEFKHVIKRFITPQQVVNGMISNRVNSSDLGYILKHSYTLSYHFGQYFFYYRIDQIVLNCTVFRKDFYV